MAKTRLPDRSPHDLAVLVGHPAQGRAQAVIESLIRELRTLASDESYFEFQLRLFEEVITAQQHQAESSRNAKRVRSGKPLPVTDTASWELETELWSRIVRQLRSVGDALAWRRFRFDRRYLIALSRNQPPGPMIGKAGLDAELAVVERAFLDDGHFALLHDLTNAVRISDLTVFSETGPKLVEVKSSKPRGARYGAQMRRAQDAVSIVNDGAPLRGSEDVDLEVSPHPFKTKLRDIAPLFDLAFKNGVAVRSIGHQQVASVASAVGFTSADGVIAEAERLTKRAFTKAGLDPVAHRMRGLRVDSIGHDELFAPYAIYPYEPSVVAALTVDRVILEHQVGWDRIEAAMELHAFDVERLLDDADGLVPADLAILHDRKNGNRVTLHSGAFGQLLYEFIEIERYAAAIADSARRPWVGERASRLLTFSNERATWR